MINFKREILTGQLSIKLKEVSRFVRDEIEKKFSQNENELNDAILHSLLPVGKCLRPFLLISAYEIFSEQDKKFAIEIATAVEMVHVFSLIHDDLPALDDDDFRRNRLSCHKKFGEAIAILAGDALLTKAFESIVNSKYSMNCEIKNRLITLFCEKIGAKGMIMGQVFDLSDFSSENKKDHILGVIEKKTCALFECSVAAGGIIGGADENQINQLQNFARNFGSAFQIIDDLEDLEEDEKNSDKVTIVMLIGSREARKLASEHLQKAANSLESFGKKAENLNLLIEQLKFKVQNI